MKLFKNIIEDGYEYNKMLARLDKNNEIIGVEEVEVNKVITISLEEYKELLIYKGKYLGLTGITKITKLYADEVEGGVKDDNKNSK